MNISEKIQSYYDEIIKNEITRINLCRGTKSEKSIAIQSIKYLSIKLTPLLMKDVSIIEYAYKKGEKNHDDGVFKIETHDGTTIVLSKEVATELHEKPNIPIIKLNAEEITDLLIAKIKKNYPCKFINNIEFVNIFENQERKNEIIQDFFNFIPNDYINKKLEIKDNWGDLLLFDENGKKKEVLIHQLDEKNHKNKFASIKRNTRNNIISIKRVLEELGYKSPLNHTYASSIDDHCYGILFSINPIKYDKFMLEVFANSSLIYTKDNASLMRIIMSMIAYKKIPENRIGILYKIKDKAVSNVIKMGSGAIDEVILSLMYIHEANQVEKMFKKDIDMLNFEIIEKIELSEGGIVSSWIKRKFYQYDENKLPCQIDKIQGVQTVVFDMEKMENFLGFYNAYRFRKILVTLLNILGNLEKKENEESIVYKLTMPDNVSFKDVIRFVDKATVLEKENLLSIQEININLFNEYCLNKKIKRIEAEMENEPQSKIRKKM